MSHAPHESMTSSPQSGATADTDATRAAPTNQLPTEIRVIVAVCTFNRPDALQRLLVGLQNQAQSSDPIIHLGVVVVDDHSSLSAEPVVTAVASSFPLGAHYVPLGSHNISTARNTALQHAMQRGDWVALTDDDCDPPEGWLNELVSMQRRTNADIVTGPFTLYAHPDAPRWYHEQGFAGGSVLYEDGIDPPHGCTANALLRSDFLTEHPAVRFREDYGETGGEDMVFFHTAREAGAVHRYARNAMMFEEIPLSRTSFRFALTKQFWFGNNMTVINRRTREFPMYRLGLRGMKAIALALWSPLDRLRQRQRPHLRMAAREIAFGLGLIAGVFGVKARHH